MWNYPFVNMGEKFSSRKVSFGHFLKFRGQDGYQTVPFGPLMFVFEPNGYFDHDFSPG